MFFFLFLPTKESCHPKKASQTKEDNTQDMPKRENNNCHKTHHATMEEDVINGFFFNMTKETSVCQRPPAPLKLIQGIPPSPLKLFPILPPKQRSSPP